MTIFVSKISLFCLTNNYFYIKHDYFCLKNYNFYCKYDHFSIFLTNMNILVSKLTIFVVKMEILGQIHCKRRDFKMSCQNFFSFYLRRDLKKFGNSVYDIIFRNCPWIMNGFYISCKRNNQMPYNCNVYAYLVINMQFFIPIIFKVSDFWNDPK